MDVGPVGRGLACTIWSRIRELLSMNRLQKTMVAS